MSERTQTTDYGRLVELLTDQCRAYSELSELSCRQGDMISEDSEKAADALLSILSERQKRIQRITRLNQELAPFRRDWEGTYAGLTQTQQECVSELVTKLNELLGAILSRDREDQARLETRRQIIRGEMDRLSGGRIANSGYSAATKTRTIGSADVTG